MQMIGPLLLLAGAFVAGPARAAADYRVEVDAELPRRAVVTATLVPGERGLCFTRAAADTGLSHGWATFVHALSVTDAAGSLLDARYDGDGCWSVAATGDAVTVSYTVLLQHDRFPNEPGDDELAYAGDWGQFWTGRALFVEGSPADETRVGFDLPEGWAVTAPWPAADDSGRAFAPAGPDALFDSGLMLGTHEARRFTTGDATVSVGLAGDGPRARGDEVVAIVRGALSTFTDLHRASPDGHLAVFLGSGRLAGGGVMGTTISMLVPGEVPDELMPMLAYIVTHESFHLWNANLDYADRSEMYWFAEGFAEYYAYRAMHAQGLMDTGALLATVEQRGASYQAAAGRLSMVDAGEEKLDHYDLIYSGGMIAALALDMRIMDGSAGRHRLDDVMPGLYAAYRGGGERLDVNRLATRIEMKLAVDTRDILECCVNGTAMLAVEPLLAQFAATLGPDPWSE